MASHAMLMILKSKIIEEKRTLDAAAGRLLKVKINLASEDPMIQQLIDDAALDTARSSLKLETLLEHIEMRTR